MIVSTFGPESPMKCSGLDVVRYDAESLHREFGIHFRLLGSSKELHRTPFGTIQQFLYCYCRPFPFAVRPKERGVTSQLVDRYAF